MSRRLLISLQRLAAVWFVCATHTLLASQPWFWFGSMSSLLAISALIAFAFVPVTYEVYRDEEYTFIDQEERRAFRRRCHRLQLSAAIIFAICIALSRLALDAPPTPSLSLALPSAEQGIFIGTD